MLTRLLLSLLLKLPPQRHLQTHSHSAALPNELKLAVLRQIPNTTTLLNLALTCSAFYKVYAAAREEIFTAVTINELLARGVNVTQRTAFSQAHIRSWDWCAKGENALQVLHHQLSEKTPPKLSLEQCRALAKIDDMKPWRFVGTSDSPACCALES